MKLKKHAFIVLNFEKFWNRLCSQNRAGKANHSFVRRGTVGPKNTKQLFFYVTRPQKNIQGYAEFVERVTGNAKELWQSLGHESLLGSYDEYQDFLQGRKKVTFVRFKNLKEFPKPVSVEAWARIVGNGNLAQGGRYITKEMANRLLLEGGVEL